MEKNPISEVILKIPPSIAADIGTREILTLLIDKALGKKDLYQSKIKLFESKYGTNYASFKKKLEIEDENFQEWDDLILWEGYLLAYREWCKIQGSQTLYEIISALKQSPIVYSMDVLELIDEESVQLIKIKAAIKNNCIFIHYRTAYEKSPEIFISLPER